MPLEYPTYSELVDTANAALRRIIPSLDPTLDNQFSKAFVESCAALAHSNNLQIKDVVKQLFPQTATGEFLDNWLNYENLTRLPAVGSRGLASLTGTSGTTVPTGTAYDSDNGFVYETQSVGAIVDTTVNIDSIVRSGTTATATTISSHGLSSGNLPVISGAGQAEYNGSQDITVISLTQFTFTVAGSPTTPATGTIVFDYAYATIELECTSTGSDTNISGGGALTIQTSITNVDDDITIGPEGFTAGASQESDDDARVRLLLARSSRSGVFTADQIRLAALSIQGNTRVFVIAPEFPIVSGGPSPGEVYIYFLRDNDVNPLPSSTIIAETKTAIIEDGRMPANTDETDVVVAAPVAVTTNYLFASISPDTPTMRTAIENQINAFYRDSVQFSEDIEESSYVGAISNTIDTETGTALTSFSLTSPSGAISIDFGEIGFAGTVSFA